MPESIWDKNTELLTTPEITSLEELSEYARQRRDELNSYDLPMQQLGEEAAKLVAELNAHAEKFCRDQQVICQGLYQEMDLQNFSVPPTIKEATIGITEGIHRGFWASMDILNSGSSTLADEDTDTGVPAETEEKKQPTYARLEVAHRILLGTQTVSNRFQEGAIDIFVEAPVDTCQITLADSFYIDLASEALKKVSRKDEFIQEANEIFDTRPIDFKKLDIAMTRALRRPNGYKNLEQYISYMNGLSGLVGKTVIFETDYVLDPEDKPISAKQLLAPIEVTVSGFIMTRGYRLNAKRGTLNLLSRPQLNLITFVPEGPYYIPVSAARIYNP